MISLSSFSKRRGTTLAGIFSVAVATTLLLCGAGSVPVENFSPQGTMQGDLNAGGHSLTNAATVSATNVVVSGTLTAPAGFTLPYSQVSGKPTLGSLASVSPGGTASSTTFLKYDGTTFSYAVPPGTTTSGTALLYGNGSGGFSSATVGSGLVFSGGMLSANVGLGANTFTADQTAPNHLIPSGPGSANIAYIGDSRTAMGFGEPTSTNNAVGAINSLAANLQVSGFGCNAFNADYGLSGTGIEAALLNYFGAGSVTTTGTVTSGSLTVTITGSTTGLSGTMLVGGAGIPPGFHVTISGSTVTLVDSAGLGRTPTTSGTGVTLNFSTAVYPYNSSNAGSYTQFLNPPHQLSNALTGLTGVMIDWEGINDTIGYTYSNCTVTSGSPTITLQTNYLASTDIPYVGEIVTSTHFPGGTVTVTAVAQSGQTITLTASTNATGSSTTESITTTPVASAWETDYQALVNDARSDGQKVVVMTMPEAWTGSLAAGNTVRTTENTWMVSTYGGSAVTGVTLCDVASQSFCSTNDPNVYRDGIHFTDSGEAVAASYLNSILFSAYPGLAGNNPLAFGRSATIPVDALAPITQLNLGNGGATAPLILKENTSSFVTSIGIGTGSISYSENTGQGLKVVNSAGNAVFVPTAVSGFVPVIPSTTPTPVSGSTSGTATFIQTFNEAYKKEIIVSCNALTGTASFTFPTAFTNTPVVVTTSGPASSVVTALSTTAMTVTGSTTSGPLFVEGY